MTNKRSTRIKSGAFLYNNDMDSPVDLNFQRLRRQELERRYLYKLYELSIERQIYLAKKEEMISALGITCDEWIDATNGLLDKDLVKKIASGVVQITPEGNKEVEKIMALDYEALEYRILQKLVENGVDNYTYDDELADSLSIPKEYLRVFLIDFDKKGWINVMVDGTIQLCAAGVTAFHKGEKQSGSTGGVNNFTINARDVAFQNQTQNSTQNVHQVKITNNPDFNSAVDAVVNLIKESSLNNFKKEDLLTDVERIKNLAQLEPSQELVEHAKSKINYLETAIKGTELVTKLAPYLPQLYAYFESLVR